jgi:hypothetical protein
MTHDTWPSPDTPPGPLPRIEDMPIVEHGYEQEAVRRAFDSFYRHAAQLDASLRALEGVDAFRRDADALRNDLRALRALGFGGGQEPAWTMPRYDASDYARLRREVPIVVLRLGAEAALIVAVAVIAAVAHFRPAVVIALMAAVFVIVAVSEWLAGRARFVPPAVAFLPSGFDGEPAPYVEAPGPEWGAAGEPDEETEPESLTFVASAGEVESASQAAVDPWERGPEEPDPPEEQGPAEEHGPEHDRHSPELQSGDGAVPEDAGPEESPGEESPDERDLEAVAAEGEPVLAERAGLFRRRRR